MSNILETVKSGDTLNFSTYAPFLGNSYKSVVLLSILSAVDAIDLGLDAPSMHAKVFPSLPEGSINDYRRYQYLRIQHINGDKECVGVPWIIPATLEVKSSSVITAVFTGVGPADVEKIRQMCAMNNYKPELSIE